MKERYLKSNVFLSPSVMENSPNSVGEAMLLGMPVISSDVGGVRNLLVDITEGFIYSAKDLKELVNAVCEVFSINGSDRQKAMGEAATEHARKTHDPKVNYLRLLEIYEKIVKK